MKVWIEIDVKNKIKSSDSKRLEEYLIFASHFYSILLGMLMVFMPEGIQVNGVRLRSDTAAGNLNFYKGIEGFLESFPQAIYQISILFRSAGKIGMKCD